MKKLFLAWQDPKSSHWFPIGQLTFDGKNYYFVYTQGIKKAQTKFNFQLLHSFPERDRVYISSELFPLFSNRLMRPSRPDYQDYIHWLNIPQDRDDPIAVLARSQGRKATDTFELFSCPESDENGFYYIHFFVQKLRFMLESSIERVKYLQPEERLNLILHFHDSSDSKALLVRTEDGHNLGYCPRYLTADISQVLRQNSEAICVRVERVNPAPTPVQFRLLCNMTAQWHDFNPFSSPDYQPIVDSSLSLQNV